MYQNFEENSLLFRKVKFYKNRGYTLRGSINTILN